MNDFLNNNIDTFTGNIIFSAYMKDVFVRLNFLDSDNIIEIFLQLTGRYDDQGRGIEDLNVYLNKLDITREIREEISQELDGRNATQYISQYKECLNNHYYYYPKINETLSEMKARGNELLNSPLSKQFTSKLGDFNHGWSGHLGIFNFIYREINFPSISINRVLNLYNARNATNFSLKDLKPITFTFSSGPLFNSNSFGKGCLYFSINKIIENPIVHSVKELNAQVDSLTDDLKEMSNTIQTLQQQATDLAKQNTKLEKWKESMNTSIVLHDSNGNKTIQLDGKSGDILLL